MAINPVPQATQPTASQSSGAKLTKDLDSFITLLTTQLKHQDPLEPVDSTEFTSQLAQFAAVEQGIQTNSNLEKLIGLSSANQALAAVGYLGKYVEALSSSTALVDGAARFGYALGQSADAVAVQIKDATGTTVRTLVGETNAGKHTMTWDGKDSNGLALPDGEYYVVVSAADGLGNQIQAPTITAGIADGVEGTGANAHVTINGVDVPIADIVTVKSSPPEA